MKPMENNQASGINLQGFNSNANRDTSSVWQIGKFSEMRSYIDLDPQSDNEQSHHCEPHGIRNFDRDNDVKDLRTYSAFTPINKTGAGYAGGITPKDFPSQMINLKAMNFATEMLSKEFPMIAQQLQRVQESRSNNIEIDNNSKLNLDPIASLCGKDFPNQEDSRDSKMEWTNEEEQASFKWLLSNDYISSESSQGEADEFMFKLDNKDDLLLNFEANHEDEPNHLRLQRPLANLMPNYSNNFNQQVFQNNPTMKSKASVSAHEECTSLKQLDEIFGLCKVAVRPYLCTVPNNSNTDQNIKSVSKNEWKLKHSGENISINIEEELKNNLTDISNQKQKVFSNLAGKTTERAWERIQKYSNILKIAEDKDLVINEIIKVKKNQNWGGERFAQFYSPYLSDEAGNEKETIPSGKYSFSSAPISSKVTKIFPYKIHQRIFRIMNKYYKTGFKKFTNKKRINTKGFYDQLIDYMDATFPDLLESVDEDTAELIMKTLSVFILKGKHNKNDEVTEDLDFDEWSDLIQLPSTSKTIHFFSRPENAFLYVWFFLKECKALAFAPNESSWCDRRVHKEEKIAIFYQMHELYNELIVFVQVSLQESINNQFNEYLKHISF